MLALKGWAGRLQRRALSHVRSPCCRSTTTSLLSGKSHSPLLEYLCNSSSRLRVSRLGKPILHDAHHDDDVTVPEHTNASPSCRIPYRYRKNTAHDARDGYDDELQRYSKSGE